MLNWIILILLIALHILYAINGRKSKDRPPAYKTRFYVRDILYNLLLLLIFWVLNPALFRPLDFDTLGRGMAISETIISPLTTALIIPFFLAFTPWNNYVSGNIAETKEVLGFPAAFLPDSLRTLGWFVLYLVVGVVYEALLCRQLLFFALNSTIGITGDGLVLLSSVLFSFAHWYQGWKGLLSAFLLGLLFGKIFLLRGSLLHPIVLHLFSNLTVAVLAWKRIRALKSMQDTLHPNSL